MTSPHPFRDAVESGDFDRMTKLLAQDITFRSPVVYKPYEGKEAVVNLLRAVFETFEDFEYVDELAGEHSHALIFRARVGDKTVDGLDLMRTNENGLIDDFTVMVRPLSGAIALAEAVGAKLTAQA